MCLLFIMSYCSHLIKQQKRKMFENYDEPSDNNANLVTCGGPVAATNSGNSFAITSNVTNIFNDTGTTVETLIPVIKNNENIYTLNFGDGSSFYINDDASMNVLPTDNFDIYIANISSQTDPTKVISVSLYWKGAYYAKNIYTSTGNTDFTQILNNNNMYNHLSLNTNVVFTIQTIKFLYINSNFYAINDVFQHADASYNII